MPAASRSSSSTDVSTSKAYPSGATQAADLSLAQQKLKLARHSCCSASTSSSSRSSRRDKVGDTDGDAVELEEYEDGLRTPEPENGTGSGKLCNCRGFRPRPGTKVRAAPYSRNEREWGWGNSCGRCGHGIDSHGISSDAGGLEEDKAEEWLRRVKVAVRLDEMLEDQKKLLDWDYEDEDMQSLKKQMRVLGPTESTPMPRRRNGLDSRKRKSRSPADSMRLSSVEPSLSESSMAVDSPRSGSNAKRRRMQSRSATTSRYQSPAIATDGEAEGQGIGHGKMPSKSQKGLPPNGDGAAPTEDSRLATAHDDDEGKPKEYVEQDEADLEKVVQGVAMDTGAEENKPAVPPRRERPAIIEERSGLIQFRVVTNDGSPESMIILTGLKNIFQRQLPKMPREYITRLVLDRSHWSMAIVKRGLQVVGGITYRPFNSRKFAEIVFCAITGTEQVKGYGSHLMNHLKDHVKASSDVMHFLTYADNYAIGYFKKQGFTKEINLDRSIWVGYIKDYEGGTLMQCSMIPRVEYLKVQDLLAAQREAIVSKIRLMSRSHIVHPGLEVFRKPAEPKAKVEEIEEGQADEPMDPTAHFKVDPSEVPGLKESAWTIEMDELSRRPKRGPHHQLMRLIVSELSNHAASWPFTNPVNAQDVPDYYEVIKEPMDLSTMETKLENNQYSTIDDLLHDAQLIFDNCRVYNPATSVYAKSANRLERFVKDSLQGWKQQAGIL